MEKAGKIVRTDVVSVQYGEKKGTLKERQEEKKWKLGY